ALTGQASKQAQAGARSTTSCHQRVSTRIWTTPSNTHAATTALACCTTDPSQCCFLNACSLSYSRSKRKTARSLCRSAAALPESGKTKRCAPPASAALSACPLRESCGS
ncbi:hypothetical protein TSOC_008234, partial [Tetrabaena socialis]